MSLWDWLAAFVAFFAVVAAIAFAIQGSLADAFQTGYRKGQEEGYAKGFFEASHGVRTRSATTVRVERQKAEGNEKKGPSA